LLTDQHIHQHTERAILPKSKLVTE